VDNDYWWEVVCGIIFPFTMKEKLIQKKVKAWAENYIRLSFSYRFRVILQISNQFLQGNHSIDLRMGSFTFINNILFWDLWCSFWKSITLALGTHKTWTNSSLASIKTNRPLNLSRNRWLRWARMNCWTLNPPCV